MSSHKSTKKKAAKVAFNDSDSLLRFAETLKLRFLAASTQEDGARQRGDGRAAGTARSKAEGGRCGCPLPGRQRIQYLRYVSKLAARVKRDPAELDEAQLRGHLLYLKDGQNGHGYSASSMRTSVAAFTAFYNLHLGRDWKLFRLVRSPSPQTLPTVLTREEVKRLFGVIRENRFRTILRLFYACGLRVSEATALEVTQIKRDGPRLHLKKTKFSKERLVPLPLWAYRELQDYWKTHRHPRWVFPGVGRGWRETPGGIERLGHAVEPMGVSSIQYCVRLRAPRPGRREAAGSDARAHPAAFLCDPSIGSGDWHPVDFGVPGARLARDHVDLYASDGG